MLATFTVTGTGDSGPGTFRQAILDANSTSGPDTIAFNIAGTGVRTIAPTSALPDITDPVTIDGFTQPGSSANTLTAGSNAVLLVATPVPAISGGSSLVRGLVITGGGVVLKGQGNNRVEGNYIGTNAAGTSAPSLQPGSAPQTGITVQSANNSIGGTTPQTRNLISGNNSIGVLITAGATGTQVRGNYIGTDLTGAKALPNGRGVVIDNGSTNLIGGTDPGAGNVIAGNASYGIDLGATEASAVVLNNSVTGNLIGLKVGGTEALGNGAGVIIGKATGTVVGGEATNSRNVIAGNTQGGLGIFGSTSTTVQGNFIGTDVSGSQATGSQIVGISVQQGNSNLLIGGITTATRNVISGNTGPGVFLSGAGTGVLIKGNFIGVRADSSGPLGNGGAGVDLASSTGVNIGGLSTAEGNVIAFNRGTGVLIRSGNKNPILSNAIVSNGALGIDLVASTSATTTISGDGPTPNDTGDGDTGGNDLLNFPVLGRVTTVNNTVTVNGTYTGAPNTSYLLQFFINDFADPTGYGQGGALLGQVEVTTNAQGQATFAPALPGAITLGQVVTATATDTTNGNTSEFSIGSPFTTTSESALSVAIATPSDTIVAGQTLTYTVGVKNDGPSPATNVDLIFGLPPGTVVVSATPSQGTASTTTPGTVNMAVGNLAVGATATMTVVVRPTTPGTLLARALTYGGQSDTDPTTNATTKTITVTAGPDVSITGSASPQSVSVGQNITYTYVVRNTSTTSGASNVTFRTVPVPANAALVSAVSTQGTVSGADGAVVVNIGSLAAGASATVTIVLKANAAGVFGLPAGVSLQELDPNPANNTTDASAVAVGVPDLVVQVRANPLEAQPGQPFTFVVTVTNSGPGVATGVGVRADLLPGGTIRTANASQGSASINGTVVIGQLGTLAPGASATITLVAVPQSTTAAAGVQAGAIAAEPEANTGNNFAGAAVNITATPGVATTVGGQQAVLGQGVVAGYVLGFTGPLNPARAANPAAYKLIGPGKDGLFGTGDDVNIAVGSATYDPVNFKVVVVPRTRIRQDDFVQLIVDGTTTNAVLTTAGLPIDGDRNGLFGGNYITVVGRGRRLGYFDSTGDLVQITMSGPGNFEMTLDARGEATALVIYDGVPGRSTLRGTVKRSRNGGDNITALPLVVGLNRVTNRLATPPFLIGTVINT